jgi:hypothetical protein
VVCLLPFNCFGIARHEDRLFVGASAGIYSFTCPPIVGNERIDGCEM